MPHNSDSGEDEAYLTNGHEGIHSASNPLRLPIPLRAVPKTPRKPVRPRDEILEMMLAEAEYLNDDLRIERFADMLRAGWSVESAANDLRVPEHIAYRWLQEDRVQEALDIGIQARKDAFRARHPLYEENALAVLLSIGMDTGEKSHNRISAMEKMLHHLRENTKLLQHYTSDSGRPQITDNPFAQRLFERTQREGDSSDD